MLIKPRPLGFAVLDIKHIDLGLSSALSPPHLDCQSLGDRSQSNFAGVKLGLGRTMLLVPVVTPLGRCPTSTLSLDGSQSGVRRGQEGDSERDPLLLCMPQPPAAPEMCSLAP